MKESTKDKIKGSFHQSKGKLKEVTGKFTDNSRLEGAGKIEKTGGNLQKNAGRIEKKLGN